MVPQLAQLLMRAVMRKLKGGEPTSALLASIRKVDEEWALFKYHEDGSARIKQDHANSKGLKLHLGCGPNLKSGWVNVDMAGKVDYTLDLRESIPLPDGSCSYIYSEHFFEHIEYPHPAFKLLADYLRLLEPGGTLSIGVPDGEAGLMHYAAGTEWNDPWHPPSVKTRMEHVNYLFRQGAEHKYIYDEETLLLALNQAGFKNARRRPYNPELDQQERADGTLYVEATKP